MAGTQASRQRLYRELGELLSQEAMDELMDVLPPVGWGEIARRHDLTNLGHELRGEMAGLRGEMAELRGEMAELRGEMHTEFAAVRTEMTTEFAAVRTEVTTALRLHLFATLGAMFTLAGLTWAATSLT